ncbi:hypothetical protein O6H91_04G139600 [Diphasiastrum complanatum]|nr:hypothetical protein O6H91_04G139600 [Diphasiastrum complanatum]
MAMKEACIPSAVFASATTRQGLIRRRSAALRLNRAISAKAFPAYKDYEVEEEHEAVRKDFKTKASPQLMRWARARRLRSEKANQFTANGKTDAVASLPVATGADLLEEKFEDEIADETLAECAVGEKTVFMVSDGTGWTADYLVHAALGQFEHCLVGRGCSVNTHLFSEIKEINQLMKIVQQASEEEAALLYTLADPTMAEAAKKACQMFGVTHVDILGPITDALATQLGIVPSGLPRGAPGRKTFLTKEYLKRIEAMEFTIKQDDGALPRNLHLADLVLVGVSRTSKTPLSTYMAQKGYKVANVPLVLGIEPPRELFDIDQDRIYGLTMMDPNFLRSIRIARYKNLGLAVDSSSSYSDMDHIRNELEYSNKLFIRNPRWPVVEVTGKAIEETAAVILRLYHERMNKFVIPHISKRY